jgi:hypothetical protein
VDFSTADQDVVIDTYRSPNDDIPILTHGVVDVSGDTQHPELNLQGLLEYNLSGMTDAGPLAAKVSLLATLNYTRENDETITEWNFREGSKFQLYPGLLQEAWVRLGSVTVGIQPSRFDFVTTGYNVGESYSTRRTTAGVTYSMRLGEVTSLAFAVEDGERRRVQDGVFNRYVDSGFSPDFVLQLRSMPQKTLFHGAIARHQIEDEVLGADRRGSDVGYAANFAFERAFQYSPRQDGAIKGIGGRIFGSFAHASGALGYLGVPRFAVDYAVSASGAITLSEGTAANLSYEHLWSPRMRSAISMGVFQTQMDTGSSALPQITFDTTGVSLGQSVKTRGARLSVGTEWALEDGGRIGFTIGYNRTSVQSLLRTGQSIASSAKDRAAFSDLGLFYTKQF